MFSDLRNIALRLLFFICFCSLCAVSTAQTVLYEVSLFGNRIGYMSVTRTVAKDSSETYILDTKIKARVLWIKKEVWTHYEVVYKNGKLFSSQQIETDNGTVKSKTNIAFNGKQYQVESLSGKRTFTEAPVQSIVTLFMHGMRHGTRLFYEAGADFNTLVKTDPDTYEFKSSDGNRNVYHFKNGLIQEAEVHASIATIHMVKVK